MSATQEYKANRKEIDSLLAELKTMLKAADKSQKKNPENWCFVGETGHIKEQLGFLVAQLKGEDY